MPSRLEFRAVSKTYSGEGSALTALDSISFTAEASTLTALLGRSGCGKSTLLNLAGAMDFPTSGEVLIDGKSTTSLSQSALTQLRRKSVGFVFQSFQLLANLTVLENVELPLLLSGAPNVKKTASEKLAWVGLSDKEKSYPYQLSGGQMQRVSVARALVQSPSLVAADEPTGNLDSASGELVLNLLRNAVRDFGATVLLATHSAEAAATASRRIFLRDGRIEKIESAAY